MRLTPTPTAFTLPTVPALQSLPAMSMSMSGSGAETLIYYTMSQPPPASPTYSTFTNGGALTTGIPQLSPNIRQNVTPMVSPGVPPVSPGLPSPSTTGLVPDIMHLINYGDKDMGLLLSQRMELVWHGEFDRLFSQYFPHMWCLVPTFYPPGDQWRTFKDSAKVRFSCQDCGHGWTSMKGRVIFWFELNYATNSGCVMFKLYGQQCQKCKTGKFEHAMWYPEEVVKVVGNVYNRVGQIYYGFVRPPLRIDRRVGKPRNQHNSELCQACKEGLCKEEWSFT
ncbi:receptor-transporting protein 3-like isoform X2 [Mya arenaria]|uniref:receptor-transporting protein 3-like isoform X2 n=1 Tax=Mya arenaria TaxID=6604 RepID=UPI0022E438DB|nr:receptor-transporting protein 3-like isoform X2 [Mya arenaria]XP_052760295.1 receptor-transporting protein 3-like isoform X2 [Mya arenaria]